MKLLFNLIYPVVLALFGGLKDIIAILAINHLFVLFANIKIINRYGIKCFTPTYSDIVYAILTAEKHGFLIINKVSHYS